MLRIQKAIEYGSRRPLNTDPKRIQKAIDYGSNTDPEGH